MREKARHLYENEGWEMKRIADHFGIASSTVRNWKARYQWVDATSPSQTSGVATPARVNKLPLRKDGSPNPREAFQPRNKMSTVHGLFSKYLPEETLDIVKGVEMQSPVDLLWDQITLAYASLIRAQKLMHVRDQQDMTDIITTDGAQSTTHTVQFAWDKQAGFLQATAKVQASLTKMITQYEAMVRAGMADEEQTVRIEKLRSSIEIDKRRLEIEERRANMDPDTENETGIAYLPGIDESLLDSALPDPEGL